MQATPLLPFYDTYGLSPSSLRFKALCIILDFLYILVHLGSSLFHFKNDFEYLLRDCPSVYHFDKTSAEELGLKKFSRSSKALFSFLFFFFFFHFCLFESVCIQYFQVLVVFFLSKRSDSFLIWHFYF